MVVPEPVRRAQQGAARLAILDDHLLFAESLELAFTLEGYDVRRIAVPESGGSLSAIGTAITRQRPQIVLLDLDLGRWGSGVQLISRLSDAGISVVVVTGTLDEGVLGQCLFLGAHAVLLKSQSLQEMLSVVGRVRLGLEATPPGERAAAIRQWQTRRVELEVLHRRLARLTRREGEVLDLVFRGQTVHEIAASGGVSEATVRTQVKSILAKLEVTSQIAAIGIVHHTGWRPPSS
ncbi:MAG: LuxR family transcriptional regulator [Nocardioides sp.]|jgi:two-component system nitrate/nitrite response regulator NarL|nr:LuxR family transcriptional regulator [Nocardioides sp.]